MCKILISTCIELTSYSCYIYTSLSTVRVACVHTLLLVGIHGMAAVHVQRHGRRINLVPGEDVSPHLGGTPVVGLLRFRCQEPSR